MPTFDTPGPISATIDVPLGDVRIAAGDRGAVIVEVRPSDASNAEDRRAAELTRVEYADERLLVKAPKPRLWAGRSGGGSVDVAIGLPAGSSLHGAFGSADVHCDGRLDDCRIKTGLGQIRLGDTGALHLKSGAGDITVDRASGRAEVTTGSGDVRLGAVDVGAVVKNANGDTWIGVADGDVRLKAANGSIAVDRASGDVEAKSANGDVRLGHVAQGSVTLETGVGDLDIGVRQGVAAWLDVSASAGKVDNALNAAEAPESSDETVAVRARTSLGNITIRRAS